MNAFLSDKTLQILRNRDARESLRKALQDGDGRGEVKLGNETYVLTSSTPRQDAEQNSKA